MNRILSTTLLGTATAAALVAGSCAPAFADGTSTPTPNTGKTLTAIQADAKARTSVRIGALNAAIARVNAAKDISTADRATILGTLNHDLGGMNAVEATIAADTTVASAAAAYKTIFTTYRVYAVAIPQSRLAAAADRMTSTAIPRLTATHSRLSSALAGPDASKSTPALQTDLADMSAQTAAAGSALGGIATGVLAVTPADYNANHSVLTSARSAVNAAIADLKKASSDGKTVHAAIK